MKSTLFAVFSLIISFSSVSVVHAQQPKVHYTSITVINPIDANATAITYTYEIFKKADHSFGYKILANDKIYFQQDNFPGKETGFESELSATAAAKTILVKIRTNRLPPLLSTTEMQKMNIK